MTVRNRRRAAAALLLSAALAAAADARAIVGSEKSLAHIAAVSLVVPAANGLGDDANRIRAAIEADAATSLAGQGIPVVPIDDLASRRAGLLTLMVNGSPVDNGVLYTAELFLEQPVIPVYAASAADFLFAVTWVQGEAGSAAAGNAAAKIRAVAGTLVERFIQAYQGAHAPPKAAEAAPKAVPK